MSDCSVTSPPNNPKLLGGNVIVFAGEAAADQRLAADIGGAGDAEVDDLRPFYLAARQDDVVRRQVAMHRARLMRGVEAGRHAVA